ncbi:EF-hand domain-containing protein [Phenylobacterium sp.]|uniref:EF-hand domain-containing protein n=1 Tax=Phenylobacterium sp. TaxID=1871053 RepID=UPI00356288F6
MRLVILTAAAAALLIGATSAAAQQPAPAPGGAMPSAADIIKQWDTNKDGTVSKDEWVAAGRPAERFDMVDANKDGKITAEELAAAMAAMRQRQGG